MKNTPSRDFKHEQIGSYKLGKFYSEAFSGVPYEVSISVPTSIGRDDSFNPNFPDPGGPQKTLRILVFLHETSHFVHDMSLGACMEIDYLTDSALGALLQVLKNIPADNLWRFPILKDQKLAHLKTNEKLSAPLDFLEERELMADALLARPADLKEFAISTNAVFKKFPNELDQLSGLSLLEGLVAVKTLYAMAIRVKNDADVSYLQEIKADIPMMPEHLPGIYKTARHIFDGTLGEMLGISTNYQSDDWPRSYWSSERSISDEGFVYLADLALHIPPFEYSINRIKKGLNRLDDFIPAKRFVRAIDILLRKGCFPPLEDPSEANQFYKTVFDSVAKEMRWPSYEETNFSWIAKLSKYKELRQEAADGYRLRMVIEKHHRPADVTLSDCVDPCVRQHVPIFHLTPIGLKKLGGIAAGDARVFMPFEQRDIAPYYVMCQQLALWKDAPEDATIDTLPVEFGNQDLFRQEIVYRIVAIELKDAILYRNHFSCPISALGCTVASDSCQSITNLETIPTDGCCVRFYAVQKQLTLSNLNWSH